MTEQPAICLVDGSGYIFRAFYALPPMTRPDGTPVNAVYGFTNMMVNLLQDNPCSHMVVVFDAKRQNFRNAIYPAYKQNRKETPPELVPQFPLIRQATEALNIPWIEQEGFEADDLIATYTRLAREQNWLVRIISADKDLTQLKQSGVSIYDPMKKKEISDADILQKFGVTPDKIVDIQSLMGDSIDNVPGATGIGPKTAAELINRYGNLDNLLAHLDDIPQEKRREGLKRDRDQILISRRLVQLDAHVPVTQKLSDFTIHEPDSDHLNAFLAENGFKSLTQRIRNRIPTEPTEPPQAPDTPHYELIQSTTQLKQWLGRIRDTVALDTETTGLGPMTARLVGFSLAIDGGQACYVPLRHGQAPQDLFDFEAANTPAQIPVAEALALLRPILENPSVLKIGHNIKYDWHILAGEYGSDFRLTPIADTMVMSAVLNGSKHGHGLDELAERYLNHSPIKYTDVCGTGQKQIAFNQVPLDQACSYAAEDADMTYRLYHVFSPRLAAEDTAHIYRDYDLPLIPILARMEQAGILVDRRHLADADRFFTDRLAALTTEIYAAAGEEFNINSPAQLGSVLFDKQGLAGGKKGANGAWTTDVKVLEKLAAEGSVLAEKVLSYRGFAKLKSTYVDSLLALSRTDPRIHTSFSLTATNTGRLASSDPNLQNIPIRTDAGKEIRRAFIAGPGYRLLAADYSQIELRLMAEVAGVKRLKNSFLQNEDIHARTASEIFGIPLDLVDSDTRRRAKAINFGIIYGMSAFGLAANLGIDRTEAQRYIQAYFAQYPEIQTYMRDTEQFALAHGYVLTPFGRKCFIQGLDSGRTRAFALRSAINAPIQGGAADIIKRAMQRIDSELRSSGLDCKMLLQVHDELVFEVAEGDIESAKTLIRSAMEGAVRLSIPLIAEVGTGHNWFEAH